jgi:hypothetical protein
MTCANTECKWQRDGECVLFVGVTCLECKYRKTPSAAGSAARKQSTATKKTKGK